jgi:hypothetical protein
MVDEMEPPLVSLRMSQHQGSGHRVVRASNVPELELGTCLHCPISDQTTEALPKLFLVSALDSKQNKSKICKVSLVSKSPGRS